MNLIRRLFRFATNHTKCTNKFKSNFCTARVLKFYLKILCKYLMKLAYQSNCIQFCYFSLKISLQSQRIKEKVKFNFRKF